MAAKDDRSKITKAESGPDSSSDAVAEFLARANALSEGASASDGARLVFALDATMSRQPTWDLACRLQGEMFAEAALVGGIEVQLVYFRGLGECRASKWVSDAGRLAALMERIECRGGQTQIARVLSHAVSQGRQRPIKGLVFVGDAMEEDMDGLCARAGELALLGVPAFIFQEGRDPTADTAFREIARITRGAWFRFNRDAASELAALLRAVAAYAAGGRAALAALSSQGGTGARLLLQQMRAS
jgi:hypothetical protein